MISGQHKKSITPKKPESNVFHCSLLTTSAVLHARSGLRHQSTAGRFNFAFVQFAPLLEKAVA